MHALICGVTLSGKTTLARSIARDVADAGQNVIVYDPVGTTTGGGGWPSSAVVFDDPDEFIEYMNHPAVNCAHVFVDEADEVFSLSHKGNFWLPKKGRHFGFQLYMITQRPKMIAPTARKQVGVCYMFRLAVDDARELAADFGFSDAHKIMLDKGDFLVLNSGQASILRANIFDLLNNPEPSP
jgi:hypothetical protein